MAMVGLFLFIRAAQALRVAGRSFLTTSAWEPDSHHFGVAAVLTGTVLIATVAILIAVPLATGMALYISEYAPRRAKRTLISLVDLMAAVPSVVYGLWGFFFLQGQVIGVARWITTYFGWIPTFRVDGADPRDPLESPRGRTRAGSRWAGSPRRVRDATMRHGHVGRGPGPAGRATVRRPADI
jgi:phosphate transport system permease protein